MTELQYVWDLFVQSPVALACAALLVAAVVGRIATRVLRGMFIRIARRTPTELDDLLAARLAGPVSTLITLQLFGAAVTYLPITGEALTILHDVIAVVTIVVVLWGGFRALDLSRSVLERRPWALERPAARSLLALASRLAKAAIVIFGTLVALSQLGVSVASLIAGLGIGGLAIALAAQKTVENLFGALSIGLDQPMREGDFVKVYDFVGTVERIGLRSTRIRTLDRTLVTIPNGDLATQRVESYTARDRIRLACTIGVEYGTTVAQMRTLLGELERVLREHPQIWPDAVVVRFKGLGESSLDIEIMAWFQTTDFAEFQAIRQDILLRFLEVIEAAGCSCAFPTRTLHVLGTSAA